MKIPHENDQKASSESPSHTWSDSSEPVYKYRDDTGEEIEFIPEYGGQVSSPKYFAEAVAEEDYNQSNPDLHDPADWPRTYEIWWQEKWVSVDVDMDYSPNFSGKIHDQNANVDLPDTAAQDSASKSNSPAVSG